MRGSVTIYPMDQTLKELIIRSAEFDEAISKILVRVKTPPLPQCRMSKAMAGISIEHADSIRMLAYSNNFTSAISLLRIQYETTARTIWLLFIADKQYIEMHDSPLTMGSDGYKDGPTIDKMLRDLDTNTQVPRDAVIKLTEFKTVSWRALGSFVHGGKHPLKRKQDGYPLHLVLTLTKHSNALLIMVAMAMIVMSGDESLSKEFWQLQNQFKDCLPPYIPQNS